ncbi:MAG: hypothetical protein EOO73_26310 [Myxococcales bacterium]|nr:MAG: hypothetical protein EOO73_26310 [Myxococcales bacterium]
MLRAFGKISSCLLVTLALASACGSDDGKKRTAGDEAGAGGQAGAPELAGGSGGSGGGDGGEAPLPSAGQGGQPPVATGGAGGESPLEPVGGAGGAPPQPECCQPLTCDDVDFECGYTNDGCGDYVVCGCPAGTQCGPGALCAECTPSPTVCDNRCGEVLDDCNTPTQCGDDCDENNPGSVCYQGYCCSPITACVSGVCGVASDGCGGTVDCGNSCEGIQVCYGNTCCAPKTDCDGLCGVVDDGCGNELNCNGTPCEDGECQPNGTCCTPNADTCSSKNCGFSEDGCGNLVPCGEQCEGTTSCIQNSCKESVCKAQSLDCGYVSNDAVDGGLEYCGDCAEGVACSPENHCFPVCD